MEEQKRVVIVDDSASLRAMLRHILESDGRFNVVAEAADAFEARDAIRTKSPHVVTLDVAMPRMSGLSFLEKIIALKPLPVVMLSSLTSQGSDMAVEALAKGAVDCVGKSELSDANSFKDFADRVYEASMARVEPRSRRPVPPDHTSFFWNGRYVVIGSSTGGVEALERVLGSLPSNAPPIAIVQHMPAYLMTSFVRRLAGLVGPKVMLARDGLELKQGMVVFAPGGEKHLELAQPKGQRCGPTCWLVDGPQDVGHRPAANRLFHSTVPFARDCVSVLLTGMGSDGADGMLAMRNAGARSLAQSRESCTIWGMPRVAWEIGAAEALCPLEQVAPELLKLCGKQIQKTAQPV